MTTAPLIVFCTTCKGRLQHLKKTLPKNLADNVGYPNCKFVVLDYGDTDGLLDYLRSRHVGDIESGRLVVYSYVTAERFNVSHAKNLAARCAIREGAEILGTLDADNFTGPGFAEYISRELLEPRTYLCPNFPLIQSLPHGPSRPLRGYAGRLAIRSQDFIKAGGYDETFDTWRGEDVDLIARLTRTGGYTQKFIDNSYLLVIPHNTEVRFKEYPHARQYENQREFRRISNRTETVVNYGKWGLGKVYRNFSPTPIDLTPMPTRVFGVGLQKTATTSLDNAFKIMGFDSFHWGSGESPIIWGEMHSHGRSNMMERWYALSDMPIPLLYKQLDRAYPGSKFVLTTRDESSWLRSVARLWDPRYNPTRWMWNVYPFTNKVHRAMYGQKHFSADVFLAKYRQHNAEVKEYFKDRPDDLLVMPMDTPNTGWAELCRFLGVPVPSAPYPKANITQCIAAPLTFAYADEDYDHNIGNEPLPTSESAFSVSAAFKASGTHVEAERSSHSPVGDGREEVTPAITPSQAINALVECVMEKVASAFSSISAHAKSFNWKLAVIFSAFGALVMLLVGCLIHWKN